MQVYQKKNSILPALEIFARYLQPIAEQNQLADLSKGQSEIYNNVNDPIQLSKVHAQYIEQLNSNPNISAQNKQQLLHNANIFVGLREGQLKEQKRIQSATALADFMSNEVKGKKYSYQGQLVDGEILAQHLQKLSNGDPEVYAKMVEQASQSGALTYDTGLGYDEKGQIVGTSGYTDKSGKSFGTKTGIVREYPTKNGKVLYSDANGDNQFTPGEQLSPKEGAEYGKLLQFEKKQTEAQARSDRQFNIQIERMDRQNEMTVTRDMILKDGKTVPVTVKKEYDKELGGYVETYHIKDESGKWKTIEGKDIDRTKTFASDYKDDALAQDAKESQYEGLLDKKYKQSVKDLLANVKPLMEKEFDKNDVYALNDLTQAEGLYMGKYKQRIYDTLVKDIEAKIKKKKNEKGELVDDYSGLSDSDKVVLDKWGEVQRKRNKLDNLRRTSRSKGPMSGIFVTPQ